MQKNQKKLPLRDGVGVVVLNKENKVFIAKRIDNPKNYWQMPQGGVDTGENFYNEALRELEEETSIKNVSLVKEIQGFITYILPRHLIGIIWKGKYKGQKQKWYVVKFNGKDSEININTKRPEFLEWRWTSLENITNTVVDFKLDMYKKIQHEVKKIIPN